MSYRRVAPYAVLLLVFAASRAVAWSAGLRFDLSPLQGYWQLADPRLLRDELWATVLHLHAQPPLFNLFVGAVLHAPRPELLFAAVYLSAGLVVQVGTYRLLRFAGLGVSAAVVLASLVVLRPGFLLTETWLMYDQLVIALLVLAALAALRLGRRGRGEPSAGAWAVFAGLVAGLALGRALFHLVWVVAVVGWMLALRRPLRSAQSSSHSPTHRARRRRIVAAALLPVAVVAAFYGSQALRFGVFGPSSWLGMNLARVARASLDRTDVERLRRAGTVSELFVVPPFSRPERYGDLVPAFASEDDATKDTATTDDAEPAVLVTVHKSTGVTNFHHRAWIDVSRRYRRDALAAFAAEPGAWAESMAKSVFHALRPLTDVVQLEKRLAGLPRLAAADAAVRRVMLPIPAHLAGKERRLHLLLYLFVPFALVAGGAWTRALWAGRRRGDRGRLAVVGFLFGTTLYVLAVGLLLESGENQRFRAYVDPFLVVLAAGGVRAFAGERRSARMSAPRPRGPAASPRPQAADR